MYSLVTLGAKKCNNWIRFNFCRNCTVVPTRHVWSSRLFPCGLCFKIVKIIGVQGFFFTKWAVLNDFLFEIYIVRQDEEGELLCYLQVDILFIKDYLTVDLLGWKGSLFQNVNCRHKSAITEFIFASTTCLKQSACRKCTHHAMCVVKSQAPPSSFT